MVERWAMEFADYHHTNFCIESIYVKNKKKIIFNCLPAFSTQPVTIVQSTIKKSSEEKSTEATTTTSSTSSSTSTSTITAGKTFIRKLTTLIRKVSLKLLVFKQLFKNILTCYGRRCCIGNAQSFKFVLGRLPYFLHTRN